MTVELIKKGNKISTARFINTNGIDVTVGNEKESTFKPHMRLFRWNKECSIDVELQNTEDKTPTLSGEKLKYSNDDLEINFYMVDPDEANEDGCMEYEVILKNKPTSNIIKFDISSENLEFYYQEPRTAYEKELITVDGITRQRVVRDDNVEGSYAVYHSSKKDNEYKTGKAFHIYRPLITDNEGKEVWGALDITNGIMSITIDQDFLNNASYPVVVDPTFGETGIGTSSEYAANLQCGSWFNCTEAGIADSITVYDAYGSALPNIYAKCAIYKKSDNGKVCESEQKSNYSSGWIVFNIAGSPSLTNQDYWLLHWQDQNYQEIKYDTGAASGKGHRATPSYGAWPSSISITGQTRLYSIYCTYTAAGADDTNLLDGKIRIKSVATVLADGKVKIKTVATVVADGKVSVQNIDSSVVDGKVQVKNVATLLADGKVRIKNVATPLVDGLIKVKNVATNLLDGKTIVISTGEDTGVADGKVRIKSIATVVADGKVRIKSVATDLLDGKVIIKTVETILADGKVRVKSVATDAFDGWVRVKDVATDLLDGKIKVKNFTTDLLDGKVSVKTVETLVADGKIRIKNVATDLLDGLVKVKNFFTNLVDGKVIVSGGIDPVVYRISVLSSEEQHTITIITDEVQHTIDESSEQQHVITIIDDEE